MNTEEKEIYAKFQKKSGSKGGKSTFKKYGRAYMAKLGKKSARLRKKKVESEALNK